MWPPIGVGESWAWSPMEAPGKGRRYLTFAYTVPRQKSLCRAHFQGSIPTKLLYNNYIINFKTLKKYLKFILYNVIGK
jgi:hypothetical protein